MEQNPSKLLKELYNFISEVMEITYDSPGFDSKWDTLQDKVDEFFKQPQPGDIVEVIGEAWKNDDSGHVPDYCLVYWERDGVASQYRCDDGNTQSEFDIWKWRWPGEKEWRR